MEGRDYVALGYHDPLAAKPSDSAKELLQNSLKFTAILVSN
jgi:hypothetical protein